MVEQKVYEYWLDGVRPLSCKKKRALCHVAGGAQEVYYMEETKLKKMCILTEKEFQTFVYAKKRNTIQYVSELIHKQKIKFSSILSPEYPQKLKEIDSPPFGIYVKGKLPSEDSLCVAVIGARQCSPYGRYLAGETGRVLAEAGVQVISGMARGIDGICQKEAVRFGGESYGVLAGGTDICYPRDNFELYMKLQETGGVLSEHPPGTPPIAQLFPARNRIISGLCDVLIVIEAKERSGTLITVDRALEQGKDVYVFPGAVTNELSKGCNSLIRQGAGILLSIEDMMQELGLLCDKNMKKQAEIEITLENTEKLVYSRLDLLPKGLNQLSLETKVSVEQLVRTLISLEMRGLASEITKNYYVKIQ